MDVNLSLNAATMTDPRNEGPFKAFGVSEWRRFSERRAEATCVGRIPHDTTSRRWSELRHQPQQFLCLRCFPHVVRCYEFFLWSSGLFEHLTNHSQRTDLNVLQSSGDTEPERQQDSHQAPKKSVADAAPDIAVVEKRTSNTAFKFVFNHPTVVFVEDANNSDSRGFTLEDLTRTRR